ncbi:MAG: hypothetical protein ACKESB_02145, partial [Candidatus Hodgkinia cicadicola]
MAAAARLNLSRKTTVGEVLARCRPQVQLYTEKLLGCGGKTAVSKFKAKMQALFPVGFQDQSLELRDIEVDEAEAVAEGETGGDESEDKAAEGGSEAAGGAVGEDDDDDDGGGEGGEEGSDGVGKGGAKPAIGAAGFKASVKLEWLCYGKILGILYIQQRKLITLPIVKFPKLPASDILNVNGIEKVLISQLGRQP